MKTKNPEDFGKDGWKMTLTLFIIALISLSIFFGIIIFIKRFQ